MPSCLESFRQKWSISITSLALDYDLQSTLVNLSIKLPINDNLSPGMNETLNDLATDKTLLSTSSISPIQPPSDPADNSHVQDFILNNNTSFSDSLTSTKTFNIDNILTSTPLSPSFIYIHSSNNHLVKRTHHSIISTRSKLALLQCFNQLYTINSVKFSYFKSSTTCVILRKASTA